jgi:tetratricopeptide (TPR) repeat protein
LFLHKKNFKQARALLNPLEKQIKTEDLPTIGTLNSALGNLELEEGNLEAAIMHFNIALEADRSSGFYHGIASDLSKLGSIFAQNGDLSKSLFYLQRSIKVYALLGDAQKVSQLVPQIESLGAKTGQDVGLTLNIVKRWVEGEVHYRLCE